MNKRENTILSLLSEHGRLEVSLLAQKLNVSPVTIRKDLDELERKGIIRREHGCALFGGNDDINNRLAYNYEGKRRIAREEDGALETFAKEGDGRKSACDMALLGEGGDFWLHDGAEDAVAGVSGMKPL